MTSLADRAARADRLKSRPVLRGSELRDAADAAELLDALGLLQDGGRT